MRPGGPGEGRPSGDVIPPEWVRPAGRPGEAPRRSPGGSVIASADPAVLELFAPAEPSGGREGCVIEPGKPCTGSGRCRQRGY